MIVFQNQILSKFCYLSDESKTLSGNGKLVFLPFLMRYLCEAQFFTYTAISVANLSIWYLLIVIKDKLGVAVNFLKYNFDLRTKYNCLKYYPFPLSVLGSNVPKLFNISYRVRLDLRNLVKEIYTGLHELKSLGTTGLRNEMWF